MFRVDLLIGSHPGPKVFNILYQHNCRKTGAGATFTCVLSKGLKKKEKKSKQLCLQCLWNKKNLTRDPRYVSGHKNPEQPFYVCCTLTINNVQISRFSFIPIEQWDFFLFFLRLWMHCQPDRFSHIAWRHGSLCSHCQETLPHKLSQSLMNATFLHPSYWREKKGGEKKKRH